MHPFEKDECEGENKEFDVFVSYSSDDPEWAQHIIKDLMDAGYKVFDHERHFIIGEQIMDNKENAITKSKRTM